MLVLLGYRHDKTQIGRHESVLGFLRFGAAFFYFLCQLYLFFYGYEWRTANFHEILVQCLTRTVGDALLNF